jgi:hypothetical protein
MIRTILRGHRHPEHSEGSPVERIDPIRGDPSLCRAHVKPTLSIAPIHETVFDKEIALYPLDIAGQGPGLLA